MGRERGEGGRERERGGREDGGLVVGGRWVGCEGEGAEPQALAETDELRRRKRIWEGGRRIKKRMMGWWW